MNLSINEISSIIGFILQVLLWIVFIYYFIVSAFGWLKRGEVPATEFPVKNRFAILIAAHNEERVIASAVRSLNDIDYPKDMYDIYVIADNCDDKTAEIAREVGAQVYERVDSVKKGKGYSLEWMFNNLLAMEVEYDAVCILDADNLVSKNFFLEMNKRLCQGHKVIQGYLDSKNPEDSWISANYSIAYWISNRLFQLPRYYLGLNCALGGTGFVMRMDVLKEIGWGAICLTEDLEFSLKLIQKNMKVAWSHEAVVYDEKPLRLVQSCRQRKRWMQGHCDCASRYLKALLIKGIKERDMVAIDASLYLIQPFVIVISTVNAFVRGIIGLCCLDIATFSGKDVLLFLVLVLVVTYVNILFVAVEGKFSPKVGVYSLLLPIYSLTWVPIIIAGFINRRKKEWAHTEHTRNLEINDMHGLEKAG
ncbi:MAG: glycosyltransferase family 2 protein [Clostridiales bacterium]|nr:glycosyltransferase family 2 protein [Clostridiales bacterium]